MPFFTVKEVFKYSFYEFRFLFSAEILNQPLKTNHIISLIFDQTYPIIIIFTRKTKKKLTVWRRPHDLQTANRLVLGQHVQLLDDHRADLLVRVGRLGVDRFDDFAMICDEPREKCITNRVTNYML